MPQPKLFSSAVCNLKRRSSHCSTGIQNRVAWFNRLMAGLLASKLVWRKDGNHTQSHDQRRLGGTGRPTARGLMSAQRPFL